LSTEVELVTGTPAGVEDSATLTSATSNAGGTVTYTLYTSSTPESTSGSCTGRAVSGDTFVETVSAGVVPDTPEVTGLATGYYGWQAVYSGDGLNNPATSPCEPFSVIAPVTPVTPSVSVTISCAAKQGKSCSGGSNPGSITWTITATNNGTVTESLVWTLSGPGTPGTYGPTASLAPGASVTFTVKASSLPAGTYTETVTVTPSANSVTGHTRTASATCSIVAKPTIITQTNPGTIQLPSSVLATDTAWVMGGSSNLAGYVTFTLYYCPASGYSGGSYGSYYSGSVGGDCGYSGSGGCNCQGTPVYTQTVTLTITSSGTGSATTTPFIPKGGWQPGTYTWAVSFTATDSSDSNIATQCGGLGEVITVIAPPCIPTPPCCNTSCGGYGGNNNNNNYNPLGGNGNKPCSPCGSDCGKPCGSPCGSGCGSPCGGPT